MNGAPALTVLEAGTATTVQDHGRPGLAHLGVPRSGVVDRPLADLVSRVVGNRPGTPLFETAGGLVLRAERPLLVASSADGSPQSLQRGDTVRVEPGSDRTFEYLAVRGGLAVGTVLGSSSYDTLSSLGPAEVTAGLAMAVGADPGTAVTVDVAPVATHHDRIRLWPGPRLDHFVEGAFDAFCATTWTITPMFSRVGIRLRGAAPARGDRPEFLSEGLVLGAIQLPPGGEPVLMSADHPTTGGYPVIAVVHPDDLAFAVRRRPGDVLRFVGVS